MLKKIIRSNACLVLLFCSLVMVVGAAQAHEEDVTVSGWVSEIIGDPEPGSKQQAPKLKHFLTNEKGQSAELIISPELLKSVGGLQNLRDRKVKVRGKKAGKSGHITASHIEPDINLDPAAAGGTGGGAPVTGFNASGPKSWATLMCKFADFATEPHDKFWFETLMGNSYPGMDHYWQENSYNQMNLEGSQVYGWYNLPEPKSAYYNDWNFDGYYSAGEFLQDKALADCTAAADADVYFPNFTGINLMFNDDLGGAAWGSSGPWNGLILDGQSRSYGVTWMPPWGYGNQYVLAQEMGHTYGLMHSSGAYTYTYDSFWEPMSAGGARKVLHPAYGVLADHMISYHKDKLGWIPPGRKYAALPGSSKTLHIERLAQPASATDNLMAKILFGSTGTQFYTVEARRYAGYDFEVPGEAIVIHSVDTSLGDRQAQVVDSDTTNTDPNDAGAMWTVGETYTDAARGISIAVNSMTSTGYNVTINTYPVATAYPQVYMTWPHDYDESTGIRSLSGGFLGMADNTIKVIFNKAMDPSTINNLNILVSTASGATIQGSWSYNAATNTAIFTRTGALVPGEKVYAQITNRVKDTLGNSLDGNANGILDADDSYLLILNAGVYNLALKAIADAALQNDYPNTSVGTSRDFRLTQWGGSSISRPLFRFDFSTLPSLPTYGADLNLYQKAFYSTGVISGRIFPVTETWTEDEVTWLNRNSAQAWGTPGGSYDGAASLGDFALGGGPNQSVSIWLNNFQQYLNNRAAYDGLIMVPDSNQFQARDIGSRFDSQTAPELAVKIGGPDLQITALSGPSSALTYDTIVVSNTICNQGTTTSPTTDIYFVLSTDTQIDSADQRFSVRLVPSLDPGTCHTEDSPLYINNGLGGVVYAGTYYLGGMVNFAQNILESNFNNNTIASNSINVVDGMPDVDLVITALTTNISTFIAGSGVVLGVTVKNEGAAMTAGSTIGLYLRDATNTTPDIWLGSHYVSTLLVGGGSSTQSIIPVIPSGVAPGSYYIVAIADFNNILPETNEGNNTLATAVTVIPDVDLVMTSVSTTAASGAIGYDVTVSTLGMNQGASATTVASTVGIYLSEDADITTADTLIGSYLLPVGMLGNFTGGHAFVIPWTLAPRKYYIGAIANIYNDEPETNATNNAVTGNQIDVIATPSLTTNPASSVTMTCATFNGTINPNNSASTAWFAWGTTDFGNSTANQAVASGTTPVSFTQQVCGLAPNTTYNFIAFGQNAAGLRNDGVQAVTTLPDLITPSAPALTAAGGVGRIDLSWTASTDNAGVVSYEIQRCTGSKCTNFALLTTVPFPGTSYRDTAVVAGTTYSYRMRAKDVGGNLSPYSNIAKAAPTADTTPPTVPTNLTATTAGMTQINLTWTASTDNVVVSGYKIERCTGAACTTFAQVGTSTTTSYNDTGLIPGASYRYRVRAYDAAGNNSVYSSIATATTQADTVPPGTTSGLLATPFSGTQINLSWTAATDNVAVTGYKIERCTGAGCSNFVQIATSTTISYSNTGLTGSTTYCYQVRAYDAAGNNGAYSNPACATTPETAPPSTPANLTATAVSNSQINLAWTASTDNVGVAGYKIERCTGSTCTSFVQMATSTTPNFNNTGLAAKTTYRYRVRAYDAAGNNSAYSNIVNGATPR